MTLEECRRFFAEEVRFAAALPSSPLVDAFAHVPREQFVGPGPWQLGTITGMGGVVYTTSEDADPRRVYHNALISLDPDRGLNNGQPSALANWINALELKPGERVFHLGCGVGYYTAIMAEIVGPTGEVVASEVHSELAARSKENLSSWKNVTVHAQDGIDVDPGPCHAMLINAGVTHPQTPLARSATGARPAGFAPDDRAWDVRRRPRGHGQDRSPAPHLFRFGRVLHCNLFLHQRA
jgi:protein-L-isoaspartate(D-aspartate) O-methyltransferase